MNNLKPHFDFNRENRNGVLILVISIVAIQIILFLLKKNPEEVFISEGDLENVISLQIEIDSLDKKKQPNKTFKEFDPNNLSKQEWMSLGFSESQVEVVLNYKNKLGSFKTLDDFKNCYVISVQKYNELKPYIVFNNRFIAENVLAKSHLTKFNPNKLTFKEWKGLGFSDSQVQSILKYKARLNGFSDLDDVKKCYVISDFKYEEIKNYMVFENNATAKADVSEINLFYPNEFAIDDWIELGFSKKQVNVILNYKKSLGGKFNTKEEIKNCYVISENKYSELDKYIKFKNDDEFNVNDINTSNIKQIITSGLSLKSANKIMNYRNALGGFCNWKQFKEISINDLEIKVLKSVFKLNSNVKKLNLNHDSFYTLKKHPYLTKDFINFLKENRENDVSFNSFAQIDEMYKKETLNILLKFYLAF